MLKIHHYIFFFKFSLMWITNIFLLTYHIHGVFTNEQSKMLLNIWKPDPIIIDGEVLMEKNKVNHFITARIKLEECKNTFSLVSLEDGQINVFVCKSVDETHLIKSCLWNENSIKLNVLSNLKKWHFDNLSPYRLRIDESVDNISKDAWTSI